MQESKTVRSEGSYFTNDHQSRVNIAIDQLVSHNYNETKAIEAYGDFARVVSSTYVYIYLHIKIY